MGDKLTILTLAIGVDYRKSLAKALESKRLYAAKHGYNYIEGNETMNISDPNALKGTYWYDPIAFTKHIAMLQKQQNIKSLHMPNEINLVDKMEKLTISKKKN